MQSQQLLAQSQVLEDEILTGAEEVKNPANEMTDDEGMRSWLTSYRNTKPQAALQVVHSANAQGFDEAQRVGRVPVCFICYLVHPENPYVNAQVARQGLRRSQGPSLEPKARCAVESSG